MCLHNRNPGIRPTITYGNDFFGNPSAAPIGSRNGVGHMKTNGLSEIGFDREKMPSEPPQPAMAKESRGRVKSSSQANFHPYGWRMQGFPYSSGWTRQERRGEYENT